MDIRRLEKKRFASMLREELKALKCVIRLERKVEVVHEKWSTDVKTLCGEMLAEVEKKHNIWEQEVITELLCFALSRFVPLCPSGGQN